MLNWLWHSKYGGTRDGESAWYLIFQCRVYGEWRVETKGMEEIVQKVLLPFPYIWVSVDVISVVVSGC